MIETTSTARNISPSGSYTATLTPINVIVKKRKIKAHKPILVINLNWRNLEKIGRLAKNNPLYPLDLMYISDYMDSLELKNHLIDLWGQNESIEDYTNELKETDIVILSTAPSYNFWRDGTIDANLPIHITKKIKNINPNLKIILVGPHATAIASTFYTSAADFVIKGEPDIATSELVIRIINKEEYKNLSYIQYKEEGAWKDNNGYANVDDLTLLQPLNFKKLEKGRYSWPKPKEELNLKKVAAYEASRGCVYNCTFCFRAGFRGKFRLKSIKQIEQEIKSLKAEGIEYIYFIDEIFAVDQKWTEEVCKIMKKSGILWGYETRPEYQTIEKTKLAYESGCREIHLGMETANREVQRAIGKGTIDMTKLKEVINYMIQQEIYVKIYLISGGPKETKKSMKETLEFIKQFPLDKISAITNVMMPYPGTILWQQGIQEGLNLKGWKDLEKYSGTILNEFKTTQEIKNEVAKFNAAILKEQMKLKLKKELKRGLRIRSTKIIKYSAAHTGCEILQIAPGLFNFFYRFYRYL